MHSKLESLAVSPSPPQAFSGNINVTQSKVMSSGTRKEIVRNAEVRNSKATVRRDFPLHIPSDSLSDIEEQLSSVCISNASSHPKTKKKDSSKVIPAGVKTVVDEKASKKLNFQFGEEVFHDLIPLNGTKPTATQSEILKPSERPRRQRKVDPLPEMIDYFKREKKEFLFCDFSEKGIDTRSLKNARIEPVDLSDKLCERNSNGEVMSDSRSVRERKDGGSVEVVSDTERLKELHEKFGLPCPELKCHFNGWRVHEISRAWKV